MTDGLPDVSVITVSYNSKDLLAQCLHSLFEQTPNLKLEVIVVDNASIDDSCRIVEEEFPTVRLIANKENLGIAKANNQAIEASSGRYILLLNPDTVVLDGAIERMVTFLDGQPRVGACGCKLMYPDGTFQRNTGRYPTLLTGLCQHSGLYERIPFLGRWLVPDLIDPQPDLTRPVDWCSAACLLVSRACVEDVGLMDERYFLYSDDVDWCKRMWQSNWPVFHLAEATVIHYEGASQSHNPRRYLRLLHGQLQYLRKWRGPVYARVYHMVVWVCNLYRYVKYRCRQLRTADETGFLSERVAFYRAVLTGRFEVDPLAEE